MDRELSDKINNLFNNFIKLFVVILENALKSIRLAICKGIIDVHGGSIWLKIIKKEILLLVLRCQ
jgi:hypothetical protein